MSNIHFNYVILSARFYDGSWLPIIIPLEIISFNGVLAINPLTN